MRQVSQHSQSFIVESHYEFLAWIFFSLHCQDPPSSTAGIPQLPRLGGRVLGTPGSLIAFGSTSAMHREIAVSQQSVVEEQN